jgi:hypothetical protein
MPSTIDLSVDIAATPQRVWRALCHPSEVVRWDSTVVRALDAPADYPRPGQHVRWRCKGLFRTLHDRPQAVEHAGRLRSLLDLGPYHIDETYTLSELPSGCRLDLHVDLTVRIPILGSVVERVHATRSICEGFETSLRALKLHCEAG